MKETKEKETKDRVIRPSLFRKFSDNSVLEKRYGTMRRYMEQSIEELYFRVNELEGMTLGLGGYTLTEYVTLLQHYEFSTHFLDWSEDAFTALYFALEKYLNREQADKDSNYKENNVRIILFDPRKYNQIRCQLLKLYLKNSQLDNNDENAQLKYQKTMGSRIPNLSILENQKMFQEFLPFLQKEHCSLEDDNPNDFAIMRYLPIAIWTSKANARLSAQNGTFLAFNLDTPKELCEKISLEEIQRLVIEEWKRDKFTFDEVPIFMYIVEIDKEICHDIAEWLRSMGMSTERVYPELKNIGKKISHNKLPLDDEKEDE